MSLRRRFVMMIMVAVQQIPNHLARKGVGCFRHGGWKAHTRRSTTVGLFARSQHNMNVLHPDATGPKPKDVGAVGESVIRKMTRLSESHGAVNLSQGFPNEPPPLPVRAALARAVLSGDSGTSSTSGTGGGEAALSELFSMVTRLQKEDQMSHDGGTDVLNQYSPPMGRPDVRQAVASYYERLYGYDGVDADRGVTLTLGATEACASALRTLGRSGDGVVIFEPYHELYPNQCKLFYLEPVYVTLREKEEGHDDQKKNGDKDAFTRWGFDVAELEAALSQEKVKILMLNTPHNPTGKIFSREELSTIVDLCLKHGVVMVTDEIYEHMTYHPTKKHLLLPQAFPHAKDHVFICNSIGKSASATGWRLGWCLHPARYCDTFRGIHDQMVVMAPHPVQYASLTYLAMDEAFFRTTLATRYVPRLKLLTEALSEVGFSAVQALPEGAYYVFARYRSVPALAKMEPMEAAMYMVSKVGVGCVPGDNFYGSERAIASDGRQYLRFAACRSLQDITEACARLRANLLPSASS